MRKERTRWKSTSLTHGTGRSRGEPTARSSQTQREARRGTKEGLVQTFLSIIRKRGHAREVSRKKRGVASEKRVKGKPWARRMYSRGKRGGPTGTACCRLGRIKRRGRSRLAQNKRTGTRSCCVAHKREKRSAQVRSRKKNRRETTMAGDWRETWTHATCPSFAQAGTRRRRTETPTIKSKRRCL